MFLSIFVSCSGNTQQQGGESSEREKTIDPHSYSMPEQAFVTHLNLRLQVDFDNKILKGEAIWNISNPGGADEIVLDTKGLKISKVTLDDGAKEASFVLGDEDPILGQALSIQIAPTTKKINITYETGPQAAALQWVDSKEKADMRGRFLYTQSQAILARSWIPCQDSPQLRFTYVADVAVPKELLALMSAENPQAKNASGIYHFEQTHPIPSYLMALAVGDLSFRAIDHRSGIYASPEILDKAAYEFADMGKMVAAAEKLYGQYRWGRYDMLILPASFPFGGMENPMLTFATPTVIAGDRSLVSLVAHELAHSWSGNLVTNSTWNDFWLNEGFTVYFERRIIEELYGKEEAEMQAVLGFKELERTIRELGSTNPDTRLNADFAGRDPDEGVTDIPYEKGYFFLRHIEDAVGRARFDEFLKNYFSRNAFQSISLEGFEKELNDHLIKGDSILKKKINDYAWIYRPGLPKDFVPPVSAELEKITKIVESRQFDNLKNTLSSTNKKQFFLKSLPDTLQTGVMENIDQQFGFTASKNAEIQFAWFMLAIKNNYSKAYPQVSEFLKYVGRRKFVVPLYETLSKTAEGKQRARDIYQTARSNYHPLTYQSIDEILK